MCTLPSPLVLTSAQYQLLKAAPGATTELGGPKTGQTVLTRQR